MLLKPEVLAAAQFDLKAILFLRWPWKKKKSLISPTSDDMSWSVCNQGQSSQPVCCAHWRVPADGHRKGSGQEGVTAPALSPRPFGRQTGENRKFLSDTGPSDICQNHEQNPHRLRSPSANVETQTTRTKVTWQWPQRSSGRDTGDRKPRRRGFFHTSNAVFVRGRTQRGGMFLIDCTLARNQRRSL